MFTYRNKLYSKLNALLINDVLFIHNLGIKPDRIMIDVHRVQIFAGNNSYTIEF